MRRHAHRPRDRVRPAFSEGNERLQIIAAVKCRTECLDHEEVAGHAAAPDRVVGAGSHVVVDDYRADLDVLGLGRLTAHVEAILSPV